MRQSHLEAKISSLSRAFQFPSELSPVDPRYYFMDERPQRLDAETCTAKGSEYRLLAQQARKESDRIMLLHIAETWERLAKSFGDGR